MSGCVFSNFCISPLSILVLYWRALISLFRESIDHSTTIFLSSHSFFLFASSFLFPFRWRRFSSVPSSQSDSRLVFSFSAIFFSMRSQCARRTLISGLVIVNITQRTVHGLSPKNISYSELYPFSSRRSMVACCPSGNVKRNGVFFGVPTDPCFIVTRYCTPRGDRI